MASVSSLKSSNNLVPLFSSSWIKDVDCFKKSVLKYDTNSTLILYSSSTEFLLSDISGIKIKVKEPTFLECKSIIKQTESMTIDTIVAIGGGKVLDVAKFCFFTNLRDVVFSDSIGSLSELKQTIESKKTAQLIACPSLPGAGSESSKVAVISDIDSKYPFVFDSFFSDEILYIAPLYGQLKNRQIVIGLFDVLSHLMEGVLSPIAPFIMKQYAKMGFQMVMDIFKRHMQGESFNFQDIMVMSSLAGYTQSFTSVGLLHGISHVLESHGYGDHAFLNACYFEPVMKYNSEKSPKVQGLVSALDQTVDEFLGNIRCITERFKIEKPVVNGPDDISLLIAKDMCTRTNVRLVRQPDIKNILEIR